MASNAGGAIRLVAGDSPVSMVSNSFVNNVAIGSPKDNNVLTKNPTKLRLNLYNITKYYKHSDHVSLVEFVENIKMTNGLVNSSFLFNYNLA